MFFEFYEMSEDTLETVKTELDVFKQTDGQILTAQNLRLKFLSAFLSSNLSLAQIWLYYSSKVQKECKV